MGEDLPEQMLRTAYVGSLDPLTRQHLTNFQGKDAKPETLKREILRFVNNAVADSSAMQIGSMEESAGNGDAHGVVDTSSAGDWEEWEGPGDLNAINRSWGWPQGGGGGGWQQ